ncbi:carbon-monoxide dehydrogenase large subunit/6-hydroxypseudooxynicotine dehydrogenase subunit gamma [Nocardioides sp. BE266]|uniref:xanthine dehydrogenase family protein molybdopterin-binding subunit n=1 Tax=Nocardioides sp. BE266 TaxID=2817725 RepID=UPI00286262B4|nr:xanthine dehydrogenase family protein molybdopterin-binding subunit [Nocardioides sp. BE266]MDR7255659.1 carbon-monoxide dehydrogenase large subunit/6-hydroxypseudooxynicotine dehydrogenase subunit gamma [Nocardioides sp. BE266]
MRRREDRRLLRGDARFVDDVDLHGQLYMSVVRSSEAHAVVVSVDASAARRAPGVRLVITADDIDAEVPLEQIGYHEVYPQIDDYLHPVFAADRVRYVGQPVAAVIADTPYLAEDAAGLVEVTYDLLPPVLDPQYALTDEAEPLFEGQSNEAVRIVKQYGDVSGAFKKAAHIVEGRYVVGRHSGVPMETRGCIAEPDRGRKQLFMWGPVHTHDCQRLIAQVLELPLIDLRMKHVDIGGNFGVKGGVFPEYIMVGWAALRLGRPVKWTEDRLEHMVANAHAREQVHEMSAAFDADGVLLALKDEIWHNHGAFIRQAEPLVSDITVGMVPGPYRVPAYDGLLHVVVSNKTPLSAYRAPGRFEGTFARERLFDLAAEQIGISQIEIRRLNLLTEADLPFKPGMDICFEPYHFDSGDVVDHLDKALESARFEEWEQEAAELRAQGRLVGNGIGMLMDKAGLGLYETSAIDVDASGRIRVRTGASSVGQGIETVLAQIVAEELQVDPELIDVIHGDTELVPEGVGSWSSRSTVLAGGAARQAALDTLAKAKRLASEMLEANVDDLILIDGRIVVSGLEQEGLSLAQIAERWDGWSARLANDEPGLGAQAVYLDEHMNYPYGVTLVQIEIDPATGGHTLRRFLTSTEAGRAINPMTTRGQVIGAAAQGIGGALYEEFLYDEAGQPLATSFMDYLLPTSLDVPDVEFFMTEDAPTPNNPFGAKGLGEVGLIAVGAAVAGAIDDAFGEGVRTTKVPVPPETLWQRSHPAPPTDGAVPM